MEGNIQLYITYIFYLSRENLHCSIPRPSPYPGPTPVIDIQMKEQRIREQSPLLLRLKKQIFLIIFINKSGERILENRGEPRKSGNLGEPENPGNSGERGKSRNFGETGKSGNPKETGNSGE